MAQLNERQSCKPQAMGIVIGNCDFKVVSIPGKDSEVVDSLAGTPQDKAQSERDGNDRRMQDASNADDDNQPRYNFQARLLVKPSNWFGFLVGDNSFKRT